jgi:hypothetical protein
MQSKIIPFDVIQQILELNYDISTMRKDNVPLSQISSYLRQKEKEIKVNYQLDDIDLALIRFNMFRNFNLDS